MKSKLCIFYITEKKECSALAKLDCTNCHFKRYVDETEAEYQRRKFSEIQKRREEAK